MIAQFGSVGFTVAVFLIALIVIVAIHEYGHYIVGRWCGVQADKFSIGFGPVIWSRRDKRGTDWQISALPLGGYVKFAGDGNASSFGPGEDAGRHTMLGAPVWARALTVLAGPMANFLFSFVLLAPMFMWQGQVADPLRVGEMTVLPDSWSQELRPGDQVLSVAGLPADSITALAQAGDALAPATSYPYDVLRGGERLTIAGPHPQPPVARSISPRSAAYRAGLQPGDVITAIDGTPVSSFGQIKDRITTGQGAAVSLTVWRAGVEQSIDLTPKRTDLPLPDGGFETRWLIGITGGTLFTPMTETLGPWEATTGAAAQVWRIITSSISGLWHMIVGEISSCNLSSPVGIAQTAGAMASQGGENFLYFIAFLSTAVGLLNLFPIPILDGGHLLFHAYEGVTGRAPSDRVLRVAMAAGLALILSVMVLALANDLILCP